jgi:lysozyme family protein
MDADARFARCVDFMLRMEGGYVDDPAGGPTNLGVTIPTLTAFRGHPVSVGDIKALTPADVFPLYRDLYWNKVLGDLLPAGVDLFELDSAVNMGPGKAARLLQRALGLTQDGLIGPRTISAVNGARIPDLIDRLATFRLAYYQALPTWDEFGAGWANRVRAVTAQAKAWVDQIPEPPALAKAA